MFWSMFAAFRLGAVWVPTNFRLMPDEVAYLATASGAKAFLCHGDFPDHAAGVANPALEFIWRIGEGAFGEQSVSDAIAMAVKQLKDRQNHAANLLEQSIELVGNTLNFLQRLVTVQSPAYGVRGVAQSRQSLLVDGRA